MTSHSGRAHIKRAMGIGEYPGEWEIIPGATKRYIHVGNRKFEVAGSEGEFYAWVPGGAVVAETVEQLRDKAIEALAEPKAEAPRPIVGAKIWINGVPYVVAGSSVSSSP